jgi:UDP-glucose 4-epimerase
VSRSIPVERERGVEYLSTTVADFAMGSRAIDADCVVGVVGSLNPASVAREPGRFITEILDPVVGIIEQCSAAGVRFILGSSGGTVYGLPDAVPVAESATANPISHYGAIMRAAEMHLSVARRHSGVAHTALRLGNVYGPGQRAAAAYALIPNLFESIANDRPFRIWGDGSMTRDYVFIDDAADAFFRASCSDVSQILNVGSGVEASITEIVNVVARIVGFDLRVEHGAPPKSTQVPRIALDPSAAFRELGWTATTPLAEGLRLSWERFCIDRARGGGATRMPESGT